MKTKFKCGSQNCGHEFEYEYGDVWIGPVFTREQKKKDGSIVSFTNPVCPVCWEKFIRHHVGTGVSDWEREFNEHYS